ncbi:MAG: OmpA family protein [Paludibacteraceae bacterium]|nr:OmpA family protein [Paludibacteraceae bacterium]
MKHFASILLALTLVFPAYAEVGFRWCFYFFDFTKSGIMQPWNEAQLEEAAEFIKSYQDSVYLFEISGHCDERYIPLSMKLDEKRAQWVRQYLIDNYNIPASMLIAVGKGAHEPYIRGAKTEVEHEMNRRIEIRMLYNDSIFSK